MKTKPNPKLIAALVAITAPPALVAGAWAVVYVPLFRLVITLTFMAMLSYIIYHFILFLIGHRGGTKKDM